MKEIGYFYQYQQAKLMERTNGSKYLSISKAQDCLARYKLPKKLANVILREMDVKYNLLRIGQKDIKIINCKFTRDEFKNIGRLTRKRKQIDRMLEQEEKKQESGFFDF